MDDDRLAEARGDFGEPSYMYAYCTGYRAFWFPYMLMLEPDTYHRSQFLELKIKKKYWLFGTKSLYFKGGSGWEKCQPNIQAKWRMDSVDDILLGVDDE